MNKLNEILHSAARKMGGETKAKRIAIMSIVAVILVTLVSATFIINTSDDSVAADTFIVGGITYTITDETNKKVTLTKADKAIVTGDITINTVVSPSGDTYTITAIDDEAFFECKNLATVTILDSVTSMGDDAFRFCSNLTSVSIGNSVTSISNNAFQYCSNLASVTIGTSVTSITSIGNNAFQYCSNLASVIIPDSVTSIGNKAFDYCSSLASVTIGTSVEKIGYEAFQFCSYLKSVIIPNSVTKIGSSAFSSCISLTSVTISNKMTTIAENMFIMCSSLKSVTIPDSVTSIGADAFRDCVGLTSITIPNSVEKIGFSAFMGCSSLKSVTIPDSVTEIDGWAFRECTGLTSITIPNRVTSIGKTTFQGCSELKFVIIPNGASIGDDAFRDCVGLTSVTVTGTGTAPTSGDVISKYFKGTNWGLPGRTTGITTLTLGFSSGYAYDLSGITTIATGKIIFGIDAKATIGGEFYTANGILYTDSKAGLSFTLNDSKWKSDRYGVHFDINGSGTGSMSDQFFEKGVSGTLKQNDFTRTGYVFDRWDTQADGKGKSYQNGAPITFPTSVEFNTLYAVWTPGDYKVTFDSNNGSGSTSDQMFTFGVAKNLSKNMFTRDGYKFAGWNTQADGKGISYADEASYTIGAGPATLYAIWGHSVTPASGKGGSISPDGNIIVTDGTDKTFTIKADNGFKIKDVMVDGVSVGAVSTYTFSKVTGDHTIYAEFERTSPAPGPVNPTNPDASNVLYIGFAVLLTILLASLVAVLLRSKN